MPRAGLCQLRPWRCLCSVPALLPRLLCSLRRQVQGSQAGTTSRWRRSQSRLQVFPALSPVHHLPLATHLPCVTLPVVRGPSMGWRSTVLPGHTLHSSQCGWTPVTDTSYFLAGLSQQAAGPVGRGSLCPVSGAELPGRVLGAFYLRATRSLQGVECLCLPTQCPSPLGSPATPHLLL